MSAVHAEIAGIIERRKEALAEAATARCSEAAPELEKRYGNWGRRKCIENFVCHLSYLSNAIAMSGPNLFALSRRKHADAPDSKQAVRLGHLIKAGRYPLFLEPSPQKEVAHG